MFKPYALLYAHNDDTILQASSAMGNYRTDSSSHISVICDARSGEIYKASEVYRAYKEEDVKTIQRQVQTRNSREQMARDARPPNFKSEARADVKIALALIATIPLDDMVVFSQAGSSRTDRDIDELVAPFPNEEPDNKKGRVLASWQAYKKSVWPSALRRSAPAASRQTSCSSQASCCP